MAAVCSHLTWQCQPQCRTNTCGSEMCVVAFCVVAVGCAGWHAPPHPRTDSPAPAPPSRLQCS
eukprot:1074513-Rhodomonas_salina.3